MRRTLVTITGPSSSGKSRLSRQMQRNVAEGIVTTTTRPPRKGEANGHDYIFLSKPEFLRNLENSKYIGPCFYNDHHYGVNKDTIGNTLKNSLKPALVLVVEPSGVVPISEFCNENNLNHLSVFVTNPQDVLVRRLLTRAIDDIGGLKEQNPEARKEIDEKIKLYTHRIIGTVGYERSSWSMAAMDGTTRYDLIFQKFDETNEKKVLEKIQRAIKKTARTPRGGRQP